MKYKWFQPAATKSWETPTFCPCSFVCRFASLAGLGLLPLRPLSIMLSFFLSLSFHSSFLSFLCLCFSAWSHLHSVFKRFRLFRANGHEVQIGVWSPDYSLQHLPHLGHWGLHLAPSLRPAGQTGQDQRLDCCYQQPIWVDTGGRRLARVAHWFLFNAFYSCKGSFLLSMTSGWPSVYQEDHRNHHTGSQRLWLCPVCHSLQSRPQWWWTVVDHS